MKRVVCVLTHSRSEFPGGLREFLEWLEEELPRTLRYEFRRARPRRVGRGDLLAFAFQGKLYGEAIAEAKPEPNRGRDRDTYPYIIRLKKNSVKIYRRPIEFRELRKIGARVSRRFTYLTPGMYKKIRRRLKPLS